MVDPVADAAEVVSLLRPWALGDVIDLRRSERGTNNWTWIARLPGRRMVLRIYRNLDGPRVAAEHRVLDVLAHGDFPYALPAPIATPEGTTWLPSPHGPVAVVPFIDGTRPARSPALMPELGRAWATLGTALANVPYDPTTTEWRVPLLRTFPAASPTHADAAMFATLARLLPGVAGVDRLAQTFARLDEHYSQLIAALPCQLVHGDPARSNTLVRGEQVAALLDFEVMGYDLRVSDLVTSLMQVVDIRADPWAVVEAFVAGYLAVADLGADELAAVPALLHRRAAGSLAWRYGMFGAGRASLDQLRDRVVDIADLQAWLVEHGDALRDWLIARAHRPG